MDKALCEAIARGMKKCPGIKCQLGLHIGDKDIKVIAREISKAGYDYCLIRRNDERTRDSSVKW